MKVLMILAASLALALAGCHRDQSAAGGRSAQPKAPPSAAGGSSSMQTPSGAATGHLRANPIMGDTPCYYCTEGQGSTVLKDVDTLCST